MFQLMLIPNSGTPSLKCSMDKCKSILVLNNWTISCTWYDRLWNRDERVVFQKNKILFDSIFLPLLFLHNPNLRLPTFLLNDIFIFLLPSWGENILTDGYREIWMHQFLSYNLDATAKKATNFPSSSVSSAFLQGSHFEHSRLRKQFTSPCWHVPRTVLTQLTIA